MSRFGDQIVVGRYSVSVDENERTLTHSVEMSMPSFVTMVLFIIFAPRLFLVSLLSVAAMTNKNVVENAQNAFKSVVECIINAKNKVLHNTDSLKRRNMCLSPERITIEKPRFDYSIVNDDIQKAQATEDIPDSQWNAADDHHEGPAVEEVGTELQDITNADNNEPHGGAYGSM